MTAWLFGCTYGPEERTAKVHQIVRIGDSYRAVVVVRLDTFRRPTGLSAFPDGGKWRYSERRAAQYLVDADRGSVRLLAEQAAPDDVWESFDAWIAGLEGDSVAYLRLTGCPRGGECYPPLSRSVVYRLSLDGVVTSVDSLPDGVGLPGVMVARRPGEQSYVRFGTEGDTVTARFEEGGPALRLFRLTPDGTLVPMG